MSSTRIVKKMNCLLDKYSFEALCIKKLPEVGSFYSRNNNYFSTPAG